MSSYATVPFVKQRSGRVLVFKRDRALRTALERATGLPVVTAKRPVVRFTWDGQREWVTIGGGKAVPVTPFFDSEGLY